MATYTIVSSTKTPLDPGEINAGGTITVAEGDVFIIDPGADVTTSFHDGGGGPFNFDVQFAASNSNGFDLVFASGVNPSVDIADGVDLSLIGLDAQAADSFNLTVGNGVSLADVYGSESADTITVGDNFTSSGNWNLLGGDDVVSFGINADFTGLAIKAGIGNDNLTFGDGASFTEIDGEDGNDTISFGDNITGTRIKGGNGDDLFVIGATATITDKVAGGAGTDTLNTQTTGFVEDSIEFTNVVCYAPGTLIATPDGPLAVENLQIGDKVETLDHGPQEIRWFRSSDHPLEEVEQDAKPVLISAGSLGSGRPSQDLIVSPQHGIFVGNHGQLQNWFETEAFAPAKSLTRLPGIRHMKGKKQITWVHFACDRHEVVVANGCLSESLLLGPMVLNGLTLPERHDLHIFFGNAATRDAALNGPAARKCLNVGEVRRRLAKCLKERRKSNAAEVRKWDIDLAIERYEAERLRVAAQKPESGSRLVS